MEATQVVIGFVPCRAAYLTRVQSHHHAEQMLPRRSGLIVYQHVIQNASDVLRMDGHNILELQQPAQDYVKVLAAVLPPSAVQATPAAQSFASPARVACCNASSPCLHSEGVTI